MEILIKAYGKVNLHLEVLNRREDGYHNIFSLNANVDLYDELIFNISEKQTRNFQIEIISKGKYADDIDKIDIKSNLIVKAIKAYFEKTGISKKISISLKKDIPLGAGLGGGSSDAAAALKVLNNHFKKFDKSGLIKIGSEIGADVPYCLTGGFATCEGIGDEIEGIKGILDHTVLIVNNGVHIDTSWAYKSLKRQSQIPDDITIGMEKKRNSLRKAISSGDLNAINPILKNDFEESVFRKYPEIKTIKEKIIKLGADYATMTGSGSSIIGLFKDKRKANGAYKKLALLESTILSKFVV